MYVCDFPWNCFSRYWIQWSHFRGPFLASQSSITLSNWSNMELGNFLLIDIRSSSGKRSRKDPFILRHYSSLLITDTGIECFHMTSRRPYWCPKTMKQRPCWCPKLIFWELNSFLMQTLSFVPINLHRCWPREWKHSILKSLHLNHSQLSRENERLLST